MPSVYLADFPEPDRVAGAPHPRETRHLLGHVAEQAEFLSVYTSGRLHHAWLISGQQGVGKATLAWRLARFLLATPVPDGGMFDAPPPPRWPCPMTTRLRGVWLCCRNRACSCCAAA